MLKGWQEIQIISWLYQQATWFQLPWQLNNVIFWDPSKKSLSPFSPLTAFSHWCAFTFPQFTRKSTQMHTGQVQGLLPAPDASCTAAVEALLPEPVQHKQPTTGAASLCPSARFVQYCYPNRDAALCTESGVNSVSVLFTHLQISNPMSALCLHMGRKPEGKFLRP